MSKLKVHPNNDGVDHINVYSGSPTVLGRWLSNFTLSPFTHPQYGKFNSIEGFWYYIGTGFKHESLRNAWGVNAKREGKTYQQVPCDNFDEEIALAIMYKIESNPGMRELVLNNHLPLHHYYVFGCVATDKFKLVDKSHQIQWLHTAIRALRMSHDKADYPVY